MGQTIDIKSLIEAGGYTNESDGGGDIKDLQIFTTDSGKKYVYPNVESIKQPSASVTFNADTGEINVTIPDKWKDDEQVKKYIDNYMLTNISGNYRNNKDVEYTDPFDETKKIKTEEWIKKLNDALQFRVKALNADKTVKNYARSKYGGTAQKNAVIDALTTDDIITMSARFDEDESWVPIPAYMLLAYPQLESLESYTNGWVKKNDFMENFYNIENGKITEANAQGITRTPEKMLAEIEDMTPEEMAKTFAFGNFISQVDPKRSNWEQFHQAFQAMSIGAQGGLYDWFVESSDLITGIVSFSWATGEKVSTGDFWKGIVSSMGGTTSEFMGDAIEWMAYTNKDALSKAQAGYMQGRLAGQTVDWVVSMIAVGEATRALSNALTTKITSKGAIDIADKMAESANAASSSTAATTAERAEASALADTIKNMKALKNAATGSANYQKFFTQTLGGALDLYNKSVKVASVALGAMESAKFASVVNSAAKIATAANFANTAVSVLGNMVFAAIVGNKELTTKVLTSNATSDEAKEWLQQIVWDTAKITGFSYATNIAYDTFGNPLKGSKLESWARQTKQKAAQKFTKFTEKISTPWLNFMNWFNSNRAAAAKGASNARTAQAEAIRESVLANEARAYGVTLSTEPGSYGAKIVQDALAQSGVKPGVTMSETLQNLARAGIVFDPANLELSEFEAWQSDMAGLRNAETEWQAIDSNISQVVHEFTDPNIQPVISQQLSEINDANSKMLNLEQAQGLLSKNEIKQNKSLMKKDEGFIYAMHSPELSRYIVRSYELKIIGNEGRKLGHDLNEYKPYKEAEARLAKAAEDIMPELRKIADEMYIPALAKAEHNIVNVMMNDGVFSRAFVEAVRADGKFGKNGEDWLRLVARKDVPKGAYTPFSGTVKKDNTLAIGRFKILDDDDITWPGNGLQELINEYGTARAEKKLVDAGKKATGKTTEIVISGEKTRTAGLVKEFSNDFMKAVKQGIDSFVKTASGTVAIGKKRSAEQSAFLKEVADVGGIESIDIDTLRAIMRDKGVPLAETIVDQESLDKFIETASDEAKKLIIDAVGEKIDIPEVTEETFPQFLENENVKKILRGELKKTSLQTGYGIKDTRARLNALVPGTDVLDWSLLGREHTNGLVPGGLYAGKSSPVKAYIMSVDDLAKLAGYNLDNALPDMGKVIEEHINVKGAVPMLPAHIRGSGDGPEIWLKMRWGHNSDGVANWTDYLKTLKERGIEKVPVAIDDARGDYNTTFYRVRNTGIAQKGLDNIVEALDKAIATGKSPELSPRDISAALHVPGWTRDRLHKRIRHSIPATSEDGASSMSDMEITNLFDEADEYNWSEDEELNSLTDNIESVVKDKLGYVPKDITADVQQAFSEYGHIPLFRGQGGLGEFNMNDVSGTSETDQVGDAYWIAPNASYAEGYGKDTIAGTIPVKNFMSDKEKASIVEKLKKEYVGMRKDMLGKTAKLYSDIVAPIDKMIMSDDPLAKNALELHKKGLIATSEIGKVVAQDLLSNGSPAQKKIAEKYNSARKIFDYGTYTDADIDNIASGKFKKDLKKYLEIEKIIDATEVGKYSPRDIRNYRALAEYAKKPVIDISEDGFASGTAFFYYKGVSPEFDKEIGQQLTAQALFDRQHPQWTGDTIANAMEEYDGWSLSEMIDYITMGEGWGEDWETALEDFAEGEISSSELTEDFMERTERIAKKHPGLAKVMQETWDNNAIQDLRDMKFKYWHPSTGYPTIDNNVAGQFLEDMGERPPQTGEPTPEGQISMWDTISPTSFANVPNKPRFHQPRNISYQDYQLGLAEDPGLSETILNALRNEQYNKLEELKEKNNPDYEVLVDKLDRANAKASNDVKNSDEVQVAADEYRKNIKNFENSVLFNQKFSYMIKAETTKNTLSAFAKENGIELPEGKMSTKSKLKTVLWQKVVDGGELPKIKGLKKNDIKGIRDILDVAGDSEDIVKAYKKVFYKLLDQTDLFKNAGGPNPLKYELDKDAILNDIDDAIDDMMTRIREDSAADAAIRGIVEYQGYKMSDARFEFTVLSEVLNKKNKSEISDLIYKLSRDIVDELIPKQSVVIIGNVNSLYKEVRDAFNDKLESRLATAKTLLESVGERAESATVTEILAEHAAEIKGAKDDPLVIKTTDANGEIQYERVSPALADIYNTRPTYTPMNLAVKILNNLAVLKKINQTDLNPRSFAKQAFSDPAMAFATVGALPGTLHAIRDEIAYTFGPALLRAMEKSDPLRFSNIKLIAEREGISLEEAFALNSEALAKSQVPFTLLNNELLRQANISKFGNEGAAKLSRKNLNEKINSGLRRVSDKLGYFQNKRETYVRLYSGEKAFMDALRKGYNLEQAENFRVYALNTATTNFRTKHTVFNALRSTVPYLTSGISGAKSFWQMFEMDPIGVTSRIVTGFIAPILYFAGEIFSDENLRKKYEALAESEKNNHIVIAVGGELILIPVGEEIGQYTNIIMHAVEAMYGENQYDFWNLMLNDLVDLIPGADFTGFTDPEMWENLSGETPTFLEVMDNGIAKMLSGTMPPVVQSGILAATGRDLYTGRKINNSYVTIDEEGNAVIMSTSTSQFAKVLANIVGGDAKVIERVVSGTVGTVGLHTLDVLASAAQFVGTSGEEGSLTTVVDKALSDLSAPFASNGYNSLERRWNYGVAGLFDEKDKIVNSETYKKYNQEIASEKDAKKRQNLINKRNELFAEYIKKVEALVEGYRDAGGSLDKWKFSKAVSLIVFEDAVRADRQYMDINTNYGDAYNQAMQTLYEMGITNPDGPSSLGYIYTDSEGKPQLKMWTPVQMQIIQNQFYEQGNIHAARIRAILDDGTSNSIKKQYRLEVEAEQPYWDKYEANGKLSNTEWDAIDDLRKAHNAKVVLALKDYMNTYGTVNLLNNDEVIDAIKEFIQVPSSYETIKGRYISSENGKLDKSEGFKESYIKTIFGVR